PASSEAAMSSSSTVAALTSAPSADGQLPAHCILAGGRLQAGERLGDGAVVGIAAPDLSSILLSRALPPCGGGGRGGGGPGPPPAPNTQHPTPTQATATTRFWSSDW